MFVTRALAAQIEAAEAGITLAAARAIGPRAPKAVLEQLGSAVAFASGEGSPFDKIIGLGFAPFDTSRLLEFEERVLARGGSLRAEVSTLADPEVAREMCARGYRLVGFENVLVRSLEGALASASSVETRMANGDEFAAWIDVVTTGFLHVDETSNATEDFPRAALEQVFVDMAKNPGFRCVLGVVDGVIAGGGGLNLNGAVAQLCGAATLPAFRRRGVQTALLATRLQLAHEAGATLAVVTTEPASRSQANVMRSGFALAYARSVLVREPQSA